MILVDTDILIWILRNNEVYKNEFRSVVSKNKNGVFITPIQYMEIYAGIRRKEKAHTELFLDSLGLLSISRETGKLAGEYMHEYSKSHGVHNAEAIIAAACKIHTCLLWTENTKHYPMMHEADLYSMSK